MELTPKRAIIALAPLSLGLPLAMDVYIPAVPSMTDLFRISAGEMKLTLTLFMFVSGLMQLLIGPLSDTLGRKFSAYLVVFIFAIGTFLCGVSTNIEELIVFRMIQAIGSCGMLVIAFAIVRDRFHDRESAMIYSILNGIIAFSPMFAPFVGSYLDIRFAWPSTFFSLLIIAAFSLFTISTILPETLPKYRRKSFNFNIFREYKSIVTNKMFTLYTYATAIGLSYLFIFCFISPYVIMNLLHIPEMHYGYYFAFMGVSFFMGSFLSAYLVKKMGIYQTVVVGFFISLAGGVLMTAWYYFSGLTINNFVLPMLLIGVGGTLGMGAGSGGSLEPFKETAGAASAVGGAIRFLFAAGLGMLVVPKNITSSLPLAIPPILLNIIGIILFLKYRKNLKINVD